MVLGIGLTIFLCSLGNNDLTGGIPSSIQQLSLLVELYMQSNPNLGSTIPTVFGNLTELIWLQMCTYLSLMSRLISYPIDCTSNVIPIADNKFSGTIPSELGYLRKLESLDLGE